MHRVKRFLATLNVETNRIDHPECAGDSPRHGPPLANICCHVLELRITAGDRGRVPASDANSKSLVMQMTHDPAPQKTGPAEDGHKLRHR